MANTKSAKAKVREIQNKTEFNKSIKNRYRTFLKKVELNICLLYTSPSPRDQA